MVSFDCRCLVSFIKRCMTQQSKDHDNGHGFFFVFVLKRSVLNVENPLPNMFNLLNFLCHAMKQKYIFMAS